jgi:hypothetical protein
MRAETFRMLQIRPFFDYTTLLNDPVALRRRAAVKGFMFFRRLFDPQMIFALRHQVLEICAANGWLDPNAPLDSATARPDFSITRYEDPRWARFQFEVLSLPAFRALGEQPQIGRIMEMMFDGPAINGHGEVCRAVFPNALQMPPHQDHFYFRGSKQMWTISIPLGDWPLDLGPLAIFPGSQRLGPLKHGAVADGHQHVEMPEGSEYVATPLEAGDTLFFSCLTVHHALANVTPHTIRLAVEFRYEPGSPKAE